MTIETLWFDCRQSTEIFGDVILAPGAGYQVEVTGTIRVHAGGTVDVGAPVPVMFPSAGRGASNEAEIDADTVFASDDFSDLPNHYTNLEFDTGLGFTHIEPIGGPYTSPRPDHTYIFPLVGHGEPLAVRRLDPNYGDNNGQFRLVIDLGIPGGWKIGRL